MFRLAVAVESAVRLSVQFEVPRKGIPHKRAAALLEVETVSGFCGVYECNVELAVVPLLDILLRIDFAEPYGLVLCEELSDTVSVGFEPVSNEE